MRKMLTTLAVAASLIGGGAVATKRDRTAASCLGWSQSLLVRRRLARPRLVLVRIRQSAWVRLGRSRGLERMGRRGQPSSCPAWEYAWARTAVWPSRRRRAWGGRNYCWYGNGWHGAGWYWCGYAARRGYGWGGPRGWNRW